MSFQNLYNHKAVELKVPVNKHSYKNVCIQITAHCKTDNSEKPGVINLKINGVGGILDCKRETAGEYSGKGIIKDGETKIWRYNLANTRISNENYEDQQKVNFVNLLKSKNTHRLECWVNGNRYSWITVQFVFYD